MAPFIHRGFLLLTLGIVALTGGCSALTGSKRGALTYASPRNPAIKCLCVWQQAEGPGLNGETTRGFSGQLFFFPQQGEVPVAVQGDLKIYVFDDVGSAEEQARPIHQVDLNGYEMNARLGDTQFGPSYTVFVPYTRRGHHEANCALRVKLTRPDGSALYSEMTQVRLAGSARRKTTAAEDAELVALRKTVDEEDHKPTSSTIAVERDGKMQRVNHRLRYIGDASPESTLQTPDREERLREYEARLRELQAQQQN